MSLADKASLLLIPTGYKSQKVYSIFPTDGVGDFDFSRSSSATRIAKNGLITTVAANVPRLEYPLIDGVVSGCPSLLLEPSRTNLITYSEDFSNAYWSKTSVTVTSNEAISPDGTLNASKLIEGTSNSRQEVWKNIVTSSSTNVISCFIKKGTRRFASITTSDTTNWNTMVVVDLELGVITKTYNRSGFSTVDKIENYGNGWYRLTSSITGVFIGNVLYGRINIQNSGTPSNPPSNSYTGDGTSYIYIYGAQLEQGSYATSYIPTQGSTVTRVADTASGAGNSVVFNDSEGVLMAEINALDESGGNREITLSDGTTSNRIIIQYRDSSNIRIILAKSTGDEFDTSVIPFNTVEINKIAVKYKTNDFAFWVNGIEIYSDNTGNTFSTNTLSAINFDGGTGGNDFYGKTKQVQYYNSALTDSELEQLTSWTSFTDMAQAQQYSIK